MVAPKPVQLKDPVCETHEEFVDQFAALQRMMQPFPSQFTLSQTFSA